MLKNKMFKKYIVVISLFLLGCSPDVSEYKSRVVMPQKHIQPKVQEPLRCSDHDECLMARERGASRTTETLECVHQEESDLYDVVDFESGMDGVIGGGCACFATLCEMVGSGFFGLSEEEQKIYVDDECSRDDPVCGIDGATYQNRCEAWNKNRVEVVRAGKCITPEEIKAIHQAHNQKYQERNQEKVKNVLDDMGIETISLEQMQDMNQEQLFFIDPYQGMPQVPSTEFIKELINTDLLSSENQERLVNTHVIDHFQKEETPLFEVSLNYFPPSWTDIAFVDQNKAGDIARYAVTWERNRSLNGTVVYLVLEDNTWKYYTFVSSQLGVNTDENRATAMDDLRLFAQEMTLLDSFSPTSTPNILSEVVIESQTN